VRSFIYKIIFVSCVFLNISDSYAKEVVLPRTVIAFYDSKISELHTSNIHTLVEMPLNHLGIKVEYYDINSPLPDIKSREDVRGVLTWFFFETNMDNPEEYLKWATDVVNSGKKYVIIGNLGVIGGKNKPNIIAVNSFMGTLGLKATQGWTETAFDVSYSYNTPSMFLSEKPFFWNRTSYETVTNIDNENNNTVHLSVTRGNAFEESSDLVITGSKGGYASSGYAIKTNVIEGKKTRQWVVDPFKFLRFAFDTDDLPKPDTTTIAGRRIYYSHIDGDGLNNVTQLEEYKGKNVLSAEVIMEKAVKPYPGLPVTLTVIAADIDSKWMAAKDSVEVAKAFFALPQVEAGSHTYSHPFIWEFFKEGDINKEKPYMHIYTKTTKNPVWNPNEDENVLASLFSKKPPAKVMVDGNKTPRAYANFPFDIKKEVQGSIDKVNSILPENKKVKIIMWSGNCSPWDAVIRASRVAGVQNINGGDTMFDPQHPDYANVAPIGRPVGNERQIYASSSNEIPYTNEWTKNFNSYSHLKETMINTELPIRLKPINIYYHLYSGEKAAGLNALLTNLDYASTQNIAPVTTSDYTHIAEGFYDTVISKAGNDIWKITNRGQLATIRFDNLMFKSVDFIKSKGVVGQRRLNGSLYVYLDSSLPTTFIALKDNPSYFTQSKEAVPYLIESRWLISGLSRNSNYVSFKTHGFGIGTMVWNVPKNGNYLVRINGKDYTTVASEDNKLKLQIDIDATAPLQLKITRV